MKQRRRFWVGGLVVVGLAVTLALLAAGGEGALAQGVIIYVDADATGGANNGSSWADAFLDLQDGLDAADAGDQIWVAAGIYLPTSGQGRSVKFAMKNGVGIYGGFDPPVDDTWAERDWESNVTILSGDIGVPGDSSDNSFRVFLNDFDAHLDSSAVLDGFTISGANSSNAIGDFEGGGMLNRYESSPTLSNLTFSGNAADWGGGMYNDYGSSPTLTNVTFVGNSAVTYGGGGMWNTE
jgi:hypothetical protein